MIPGACLLDTSMAIDLLHDEPSARRRVAEAEAVFLSPVVVGELFFGAEGAPAPDAERAAVRRFIEDFSLLPDDVQTAETYARLKCDLRRRGRPIPDNDLWIAASAVRHGLTLASRDRHFEAVAGLSLDRWDD